MRGLGETIFELAQRGRGSQTNEPSALRQLSPTGSNPGHLKMAAFVPPGLPQGAPLVVVLHGCTQTAESYDRGAGWSSLAGRHGFAVLFPEQERSNNPNLCFNWFSPEDVARDQGEVLSIKQMVDQILATHGLSPHRVYVTGLSAGGAMAAAMLATYPETFAGGAIIAGLPYGVASGMQGAFEAMRSPKQRSARAWGDLVRNASSHRGRWPAIQIWHGTADTTVDPGNLEALALQWSDVLGVQDPPALTQESGVTHRQWRNAAGEAVLDTVLIDGLAHGTPLDTVAADMDQSVGSAGPFMLEAGISSTWRIARSWGLLTQAARPRAAKPASADPDGKTDGKAGGVAGVIREAMRAAGLAG